MSTSATETAENQVKYLVGPVDAPSASLAEGVKYYLETPRPLTYTSSAAIRFSGWVFGCPAKAERVDIKHGEQVLHSIQVGFPRPDVGEAFPGANNASRSGFSGTADLRNLPDSAKLEIEVTLENQTKVALGEFVLSRHAGPQLPGEYVEADTSGGDTSQHGELQHLLDIITPDYPPFLVDVGAHDGFYLSNSYHFIKKGWTGILLEPLPSVFKFLKETHLGNENVACINKACADKAGTSKFFLGADGELGMNSTLCCDENNWFDAHRTEAHIEVEVETLTRLLDAHNYPADFSLLLIDTEGMDYEVLLGLDFKRYQPRIILTEEYPSNKEKHENKYSLLRERGYTFKALVGCNSLWLRNDLARG